jgi:hypothetical protein
MASARREGGERARIVIARGVPSAIPATGISASATAIRARARGETSGAIAGPRTASGGMRPSRTGGTRSPRPTPSRLSRAPRRTRRPRYAIFDTAERAAVCRWGNRQAARSDTGLT